MGNNSLKRLQPARLNNDVSNIIKSAKLKGTAEESASLIDEVINNLNLAKERILLEEKNRAIYSEFDSIIIDDAIRNLEIEQPDLFIDEKVDAILKQFNIKSLADLKKILNDPPQKIRFNKRIQIKLNRLVFLLEEGVLTTQTLEELDEKALINKEEYTKFNTFLRDKNKDKDTEKFLIDNCTSLDDILEGNNFHQKALVKSLNSSISKYDRLLEDRIEAKIKFSKEFENELSGSFPEEEKNELEKLKKEGAGTLPKKTITQIKELKEKFPEISTKMKLKELKELLKSLKKIVENISITKKEKKKEETIQDFRIFVAYLEGNIKDIEEYLQKEIIKPSIKTSFEEVLNIDKEELSKNNAIGPEKLKELEAVKYLIINHSR